MYILFGVLPEVAMFSLFLTFAKGIKEKRFLLTLLMFIAYLGLKIAFSYSVYFNICYMFATYLILKLLYKGKAKITDIFTMSFTSILLIVLSCVTYYLIPNYFLSMIVNRLLVLVMIILAKVYARDLYLKFNSCWNRNRLKPNKIKSLTLRNISIISFNIGIFVIDLFLHTLIGQ